MKKYLITREDLINKDNLQYYLEQGWEVIEDLEDLVEIGFYCDSEQSLLSNLEFDLDWEWDNDNPYYEKRYGTYEEFKYQKIKYLLEEKELSCINGYNYFILEEDMGEYINKYSCDKCGERKDFDKEIIWITSSYGVCEECYQKLTEEEKEILRKEFE